jgi:hypothetical protein
MKMILSNWGNEQQGPPKKTQHKTRAKMLLKNCLALQKDSKKKPMWKIPSIFPPHQPPADRD